jgi:hypothetical protein
MIYVLSDIPKSVDLKLFYPLLLWTDQHIRYIAAMLLPN